VGGQQRTWVRWLHLGENCYNTTFHMSIGMTPFRAFYGYDAPTLVDLVFRERRAPKAKDWITESLDSGDSQVAKREPADKTKSIEEEDGQAQDRARF
jgi:hypothetical protein